VIGAFAFTGTARVEINAQSGCSANADAVRFQLQEGIDNYYVAVGNSITDGFGDDDPSDDISEDGRNSGGGFEPILNDLLTSATGQSHTIANEGVGGATSADGLASIPTVLNAHPDSWRFLVQYGTNDANPLFPIPSGRGLNPGDPGYPGTFKDNMQQITDAINAAGKEVCLAKPPITLGDSTFGTPYVDPDTGARNVLIKEYIDVIDELKNDPLNGIAVPTPDFYGLFNENVTGGKRYDFEYADNLHPNGEGYRSMADGWLQSLFP
jgi:lysophospholipase L1-like esterase